MVRLGNVEMVLPSGDWCGEAIMYHRERDLLFWVDINRFLLHQYHKGTKAYKNFYFSEAVVALSKTKNPNILLVALASKLIYLNLDTGEITNHGFVLEGYPKERLNDGKSDPWGNFWVGSMANNVSPEGEHVPNEATLGRLYKITPRGDVTIEEEEIGISNTLCWNKEKTLFYFGDTAQNCVRQYQLDSHGAIETSKPFLHGKTLWNNTPIEKLNLGYPDGSTIDSEGFLWNCRFGGGSIIRVSPNGKIERIIRMPVANVTTCCFGGKDYTTLYITTASLLRRKGEQLAGALFKMSTNIQGLEAHSYGGNSYGGNNNPKK